MMCSRRMSRLHFLQTSSFMAELFQISVPTVNEHIKTIYKDGELNPESTIRKFRIVHPEGARDVSREVDFYNLDMIISVVNGTQPFSHKGSLIL